jgi:hypothetical protein
MVADQRIFICYNELRRESGSYYLIVFAISHRSYLEFHKKDSNRKMRRTIDGKKAGLLEFV